jgi:hypothetical protein
MPLLPRNLKKKKSGFIQELLEIYISQGKELIRNYLGISTPI